MVALTKKLYINLEEAALLAGFSIRHFRRIVAEDGLPFLDFKRGGRSKFVLLGATYNAWASTTKRTPREEDATHVEHVKADC